MNAMIGFVTAILNVIMIITFFIMASRLKKIESNLDVMRQLELNKPENKKQVKCEKCGKEFSLSILKKGVFECNGCHNPISLK
jgi:hypothetical protein